MCDIIVFMTNGRSVAVCCPSPLTSAGLVATLKNAGYNDVREFGTIAEMLEAIAESCPDIILVDYLVMQHDVSPIAEVKRHCDNVVVLADPAWDGSMAGSLLQTGVRGYLSYDDSPEQFLKSLDLVLEGTIVVSAKLGNLTARPPSGGTTSPLSIREMQIAALIAQGLNSSEIARELSVSDYTVKSHIAHILGKLDLRNRAQIAVYAAQQGLLDIEVPRRDETQNR